MVSFGSQNPNNAEALCSNLGMNNQVFKAAQEAVQKSEEFDTRWFWFALNVFMLHVETESVVFVISWQ
ncbi:hypothetical protein Vadar_012427 [Vaccinium darrowii]|uniref:Uncharacterized protein n=1 Tax=Vaccinium darrowii TaxID=229202 RepID=A0ACB7X053_9ERIC|nr:hypothetical protein Vadar_012427 [Vaccinium darrowii]